MSSSKQRRILTIVTFLFLVSTTFSCNRGYGCPTNFSADTMAEILSLVQSIGLSVLF